MPLGKNHDIEPEDIDDYVVAIWEDEAPDSDLAEWYNSHLDNIADETGIEVDDLKTLGEEQPNWEALLSRIHQAGWDTYDSDTRLLVFSPRPLVVD